jgi:Protein of unknown function (DUF3306)
MTADERFLSRWSRLKKEVREIEEKPPEAKPLESPPSVPAAPAQATEAPAPASAPPELPPVESLKGLASEYTEFLKPGVDESLRRSALKKLFADPYFETFEKFEAYCEDYTQGEPIPPAMLRTLVHAKGLLFDDKEEDKEKQAEGSVAESKPETGAPAQEQAAPPQPKPEQET